MTDINKQLDKFKAIKPDESFVARAKADIFNSPTPQHMLPSLFWAGGLTAAALAAALLIAFISPAVPTVSALDAKDIKSELNNIMVEFQLEEMQYNQDASRIIANALSEIEGETNHLNEDLIRKEESAIEPPNMEPSQEIDNLLKEVLQ